MLGKKVFILDPLKMENRILYPIVSLKVITIDNIYLTINYELLAFKIIENDMIYYVSNLSDNDLNDIKKIVKNNKNKCS